MCTVSYLPTASGYMLTSTRDELIHRETESPSLHDFKGVSLFYPKDLKSEGTWIASDGMKRTVCLLNGAWSNHHKEPSYRMSRGRIPLELFRHENPNTFVEKFEFKGVEPFTLVIVQSCNSPQLIEIRWDGKEIYLEHKDSGKAFLWSSFTLYPPYVQRKRTQLFESWLAGQKFFSQKETQKFHLQPDFQKGSIQSEHKAKSVSITQIVKKDDSISLTYIDLLKKQESHFDLKSPICP